MLVHELVVGTLVVPRVEGVVADHSESFIGESRLLLGDVVEVLIVTPGEHNLIKTTARAVDTVLCLLYTSDAADEMD